MFTSSISGIVGVSGDASVDAWNEYMRAIFTVIVSIKQLKTIILFLSVKSDSQCEYTLRIVQLFFLPDIFQER